MIATVPVPAPAGAGTCLLGEVIAWACPGLSVPHAELVRALEAAELDPAVARELAPRHAFARACKRLSEQRIIRPVAEDATSIRFQFTQESRSDDKFEYTLETMLTLDKQTGGVSCELPGLATLAQEELDRCIAVRTGGDITGSPQGSIISPILANVYLHELDVFIARLRAKYEKGQERRVNPEYRRRLKRRRDWLDKTGGVFAPHIKGLTQQIRSLPSRDPQDPDDVRIRYIRYADDCAPRRREGSGSVPDAERHATREMRVDPSGSGCRTRSQTT